MNEMMHDEHKTLADEIAEVVPELEPRAVLEDAAFFEYPSHIAFDGDAMTSDCWVALDGNGFVHGEISLDVVETWFGPESYDAFLSLLASKGSMKVDMPSKEEVDFL